MVSRSTPGRPSTVAPTGGDDPPPAGPGRPDPAGDAGGGGGRAATSSLPVTPIGRAWHRHHGARQHEVRAAAVARPARNAVGSTAAPGVGTTYPMISLSPRRRRRSAAGPRRRPGRRRAGRPARASTSPSSTRWPRIFTSRSARPRKTSRPSGSRRARSPVRYVRTPSCSPNRPAVSSGSRQ